MPNIGQELIPITKRDDQEQWVDARNLYRFMKVGKDFSTWIQDYIKNFGFVEGRDFSPVLGKSTGGRQAIEYSITLDMAKHLAMLQRNEKGRQARQYFIEKEKELKRIQASLLQGYDETIELMKELRTIEDEGHKWYPVTQLCLFCRKAVPTNAVYLRVKKLHASGKTRKFCYQPGFRPSWYVREDGVKDVLAFNSRTITSAAFYNLLQKGGVL